MVSWAFLAILFSPEEQATAGADLPSSYGYGEGPGRSGRVELDTWQRGVRHDGPEWVVKRVPSTLPATPPDGFYSRQMLRKSFQCIICDILTVHSHTALPFIRAFASSEDHQEVLPEQYTSPAPTPSTCQERQTSRFSYPSCLAGINLSFFVHICFLPPQHFPFSSSQIPSLGSSLAYLDRALGTPALNAHTHARKHCEENTPHRL